MSIPSNFQSTIQDFINDLDTTFPEYKHLWEKWSNCDDDTINELFQYCLTIYPERFFDILYQNIYEIVHFSLQYILPNLL